MANVNKVSTLLRTLGLLAYVSSTHYSSPAMWCREQDELGGGQTFLPLVLGSINYIISEFQTILICESGKIQASWFWKTGR